MELKDTIQMMCSDDYKERFRAEYWQTKNRYEKLHKMLIKAEAGTLNFEPKCSLSLLREQKASMGNYLHCLEIRAEIERIKLRSQKPDCVNCKHAHKTAEHTYICDADTYDIENLTCFKAMLDDTESN